MKITITGKAKVGLDFNVVWEDGKLVGGDWQSQALIERENSLNYGEKLGHPVGPCPEKHNHIENKGCFSNLILNTVKPGYKIEIIMDDGSVLDHWPEPDYSSIPEGAAL